MEIGTKLQNIMNSDVARSLLKPDTTINGQNIAKHAFNKWLVKGIQIFVLVKSCFGTPALFVGELNDFRNNSHSIDPTNNPYSAREEVFSVFCKDDHRFYTLEGF